MMKNSEDQKSSGDVDFDTRRTIEDFGDQWTRYRDNDGYYGSGELLDDIMVIHGTVTGFKRSSGVAPQ